MENSASTTKTPGRPVAAYPMDRKITVRFTRAEHYIIRTKAKQAGLKPSGWLRMAGINGGMIQRLTTEERQYVRQLIGMASNINQLAKACHKEGIRSALLYLEPWRHTLDGLLLKLKT